ncbi:MAG TPA: GNAT family N-acetyltransferase [Flavobacteriaceae bacterium]|nr:GNAT family N-acetyltransferase [Ulvibacter sp.]HAH34543.1 GNAT family N-acetyltransferase [Flavobacteriaceae bacterium]
MSKPIIRAIKKEDNPSLAKVIRKVLLDLGVPKVGTAYADKALDCMFETYQGDRRVYFVVEENGTIVGGAGIAALENYDGNICELQKMYFLETARGRGLGELMIRHCLDAAVSFSFESCYIETMTYMTAAQNLYKKSGFQYLEGPLGDTGHFSCPVQMLKKL